MFIKIRLSHRKNKVLHDGKACPPHVRTYEISIFITIVLCTDINGFQKALVFLVFFILTMNDITREVPFA